MSKMWKIGAIGLLAVAMVFSGLKLARAEEGDSPMSYAQFAALLANITATELPAGSETLSEAEYFEVVANKLAEAGMTIFVNGNPETQVTRCDLAEVLYVALNGKPQAGVEITMAQKIDFLVSKGYLAAEGGYECTVMSSSDITSTLNIPELTKAVAEGYRPVGIGILGPSGLNIVAPAPKNPEKESPPRELTASPTL